MNETIENFKRELRANLDYLESLKANIAMSYIDCEHWYKEETGKKNLNKEDRHLIANNAAEMFLIRLLRD